MAKMEKEKAMATKRDQIVELDPKRVKPFARQPRKRFRGITLLAGSIKTVGQVTPIVVTEYDDPGYPGYDAELIDGERRLRACLLGKMPVRAIFDSCCNGDRYARSVAANLCGQPHDVVEIMEVVLTFRKKGKTHEEIAAMFGKTTTWSVQHASLERLAKPILEKLQRPDDADGQTRAERRAKGKITFSTALLLVPLPKADQVRCARHITKKKMGLAEARTYIHKFARRGKIHVGRHSSPAARFATIRTAVTNCACVVDRHLDKSGPEFDKLIVAAGYNERHKLSRDLEKLCDSLLMLADALAK